MTSSGDVLAPVMATCRRLGVDPISVGRWDSDGLIRVQVRDEADAEKLALLGWDVTVAAGLLR